MRDFMDLFSLKGKKGDRHGRNQRTWLWHGRGTVQSWGGGCYFGNKCEKVRESADALARTTGVVVTE